MTIRSAAATPLAGVTPRLRNAAARLALLLLALPAAAQNTWQGQPNILDFWSNPNEWSSGAVPDGTTDIRIPTGGVEGDVSLTNRHTLTIDPTAELIVDSPTTIANAGSGAILANNGSLLNNGVVLNELFATVNNTGLLNNNATISNRLSGTLFNSATLNNNSGGFLTNDLSSTLTNRGTLNNNAGATLSNFGTFANGSLSELNNRAGATLDNFGTLTTANILTNAGTLNNAGTLVIDLTFQLGASANSGLLQTTGGSTQILGNSFHNAGGTIAVAGGGSVTLSAIIQGGTLRNTGGTLGTLAGSGAKLDGANEGPLTIQGTYSAINSSTQVSGTIINQGDIRVAGSHGTVYTDFAGATLQGGGTVTLDGPAAFLQMNLGTTITNVDNTVQGTGTISSSGVLGEAFVNQAAGTILANAPGGTLRVDTLSLINEGTVRVDAGSRLTLTGSSLLTNSSGARIDVAGGTFRNEAALVNSGTLTNTGAFQNAGTLEDSGVLDNLHELGNSGSVRVSAGGVLNNTGSIGNILGGGLGILAGGTLNNSGTLTTDYLSSFGTAAGSTVANTGTMLLAGNTIAIGGSFRNDGTVTLVPGPTVGDPPIPIPAPPLLVNATGALSGTGVINGEVFVQGAIQPGDAATPGTLTINGAVDLSATAIFGELINGAGNGLLVVDRSVALDPGSLLNIDRLGGFTPFPGETFTLMDFAGLTGTFANAPTTGFSMDGYQWTIEYNANDIVLDAGAPAQTSSVPEAGAGTIAALAFGLLALPAARLARRLQFRSV